MTLDEAVSSALLVVLESMTPAERVAFVLHDVFAVPFAEIAEIVGRSPVAVRQLATSARRRVADSRSRTVARAEHDRVVAALGAAAASGDLAALVSVLDPDVVLRSDGGGLVTAARKPVLGADHVARFLLGLLAKNTDDQVEPLETTDGAIGGRVGAPRVETRRRRRPCGRRDERPFRAFRQLCSSTAAPVTFGLAPDVPPNDPVWAVVEVPIHRSPVVSTCLPHA